MIEAKIRMNQTYTCHYCGKQKNGFTFSFVVRCTDPIEISDEIRRQRITSHNMPVGWGYNGTFYCEDCK